MKYSEIASINVNDHVEKKGGLSYLSWAWAVDQLLRLDADAVWEYGDHATFGDGTVMVFCTVTAFGKRRTMQLPVMDYKNRAIVHPDAFAINTAMQRCLVKAIALHGLGLYIYAGEDLPYGDEKQDEAPAATDPHREEVMNGLREICDGIGKEALAEVWKATSLDDRKLIGREGLDELKTLAG